MFPPMSNPSLMTVDLFFVVLPHFFYFLFVSLLLTITTDKFRRFIQLCLSCTGYADLSNKIRQMHKKYLKCHLVNFPKFPIIEVSIIVSQSLQFIHNSERWYKEQFNINLSLKGHLLKILLLLNFHPYNHILQNM